MRLVAFFLVLVLTAACASAAPSRTSDSPEPPNTSAPPTSAASTSVTAVDEWADDLARFDRAVRQSHASPFAINDEAAWAFQLDAVSSAIAASTPNEQLALLTSLVGLLDSHSAVVAIPGGWHFYDILPYRFNDGWFVVKAGDPALVGSRAVSVGGLEMAEVEARLKPLVAHDNESGLYENMQWLITSVEYLNGAGIVADPEHPNWVLERPDGDRLTVDPNQLDEAAWQRDLVPVGWLQGEEPEAVRRRGERIWTRLDETRRTFLVSVNDYGDMTEAIEAMTSAFDEGSADRLILDARYLRGGNGDIRLLEAIEEDERINQPGALTALIGRENVSAGTQVAYFLDTRTAALLAGEPTPARADNFLCPCLDVTLEHSGYVVSIPQHSNNNGDPRDQVAPDVPMALSAADFFAGRDPVLEAALNGLEPPLAWSMAMDGT